MDFKQTRRDQLLSILGNSGRVVKALALDYDETIAFPGGLLKKKTAKALKKFSIATGRRLFLVSGRPFSFLVDKAKQIGVDGFVSENGAIIHDDLRGKEFLTDDTRIVELLLGRNIDGLQIKERIAEFPTSSLEQALELLDSVQIPYRVEKNHGQVMVMPLKVSKERGLEKLLERFHLSYREIITVGDGENDLGMMEKSFFSAAVANAAEEVKKRASLVLSLPYGDGVQEFVEKIGISWRYDS
ncbi:MAG: HAD family hydrolase [Nitrososphaerales archaeon]